MRHVKGIKLEAAYEYLNWYNSGWLGAFIAKEDDYRSVPEAAKKFLSEDEWGGIGMMANLRLDRLPTPTERSQPNQVMSGWVVRSGTVLKILPVGIR